MPGVDPRDQRIADLENLVRKLLARIDEQDKRIATLEAENAELRARLQQNSKNSSKPPSADPPSAPPQRSKPTGRKPGGQPGHKGTKRDLIPTEQVDEVVSVKPAACGQCDGKLVARRGAPDPRRHQVTELPEVKVHVTEYQLQFGWCAECEDWSCSALPRGVPHGSFGPRLIGFVALCAVKFRNSKRLVQALLRDAFSLDVALGTISNMEKIASAAVEKPVEQAAEYVRQRAQVHQDETGWYQRAKRAWLWVATTQWVAVFTIASSRGTDIAKQMLGANFLGTLISDRWCAYKWVDTLKRQLCWAHLLREWAGFIERGGEAKRIGELLLAETLVMFEWWHRIRDGTLARSTFKRKMQPLMREVERLLQEGEVCGNAKVEGTCRDILKLADALWTFVYVEGVMPTNNMAEQDLRTAVIWRKLSFGTWSERGSRFVERMLTVVTTLRKQERNALDYLAAACKAHFERRRAPSLLPSTVRPLKTAA